MTLKPRPGKTIERVSATGLAEFLKREQPDAPIDGIIYLEWVVLDPRNNTVCIVDRWAGRVGSLDECDKTVREAIVAYNREKAA